MAKFTLEINTDTAAFEDFRGLEISRILHELSKKLEQELLEQSGSSLLFDLNGNKVGKAEFKKDD